MTQTAAVASTMTKQSFATPGDGPPGKSAAKQVAELDQPGGYVIATLAMSPEDGSGEALADQTATVG